MTFDKKNKGVDSGVDMGDMPIVWRVERDDHFSLWSTLLLDILITEFD